MMGAGGPFIKSYIEQQQLSRAVVLSQPQEICWPANQSKDVLHTAL